MSKAALGPGFSESVLLGARACCRCSSRRRSSLIQWNLKRLIAYSSIEHVGIMAVGIGLGVEAGVFGAMLHMTYHTLAKPITLFSAGTLARLHRSSDFEGPRQRDDDPGARSPPALLLLSAVIVTGSPPFGLFFSEMTILRAGFAGGHVTATAIFLASLVAIFCGFFYQVGRIVLRARRPGAAAMDRPERSTSASHGLVVAGLAVVSAFYLPAPLLTLIRAATTVAWGGPR